MGGRGDGRTPKGPRGTRHRKTRGWLRRHYAAFAKGDVDGILEGLDDSVCIEVHDEHGKVVDEPIHGLEAARSFFEDIGESSPTRP